MRKRIALFLATAVVISGLALWATMGSASAIKQPRTFTVIEKDTDFHFVDNPPMHQPNLGDAFAVNGVLMRNGNKAGIADIVCTLTHVKPQRAECIATFTLKNEGEINVQTSFVNSSSEHFNVAVTGGTGIYQNARGYVEIDQMQNNRSRDTFHLLP
jgi:hypothetical protein